VIVSRIRVLVVDDAAVVRRMVAELLATDAEIDVVGTAPNGRAALASLPDLAPDLITLDLEMPELDGLETLVRLRRQHPTMPVIMLSARTQRGATATLEALARGASDYVTKPANLGSLALARAQLRDDLIPKIKALAGRARRSPPVRKSPVAAPRAVPPVQSRVDVLAVGVSTGGPNALSAICASLPAEFPVPIVVVQHMPPLFTRILAERLSSQSPLTVREAEDAEWLEPGVVLIAPGNFHMALRREGERVRVALHQHPPENSCRPAVDVLFRSVAEVYGARSLGLILTGMGQDGLRGAETMRAAGGRLLAQDEATSVVWGMPGAVVAAGLADRVLPLAAIAGELVDRTIVGSARRLAAPANGSR
jgi:two-component system chemotaxis response regulator CheB